MKKLRAFTLVEMLITVGIAAILLSLAAPSFVEMINNNRRASHVNEFVSSMVFTRSEALKRGHRVGLCRASNYNASVPTCGTGSGWEDGWVIFDDQNANGQPDAAADVLRAHGPLDGDGVTLRGNTKVASLIAYTASGRTAGTNGKVTWCDSRGIGADARVIIFPLSGRVRTVHGDHTDAPGSCT